MKYDGEVFKQTNEALTITVDINAHLASGESIASWTVFCYDLTDGSDVTSTMLDTANDSAAAGVYSLPIKAAGTAGKEYHIEIVFTTDAAISHKIEADYLLVVDEGEWSPADYNLRGYRLQTLMALSIADTDEFWTAVEIDHYVNRAIKRLWTWLVSWDSAFHITETQSYALVLSAVEKAPRYALSSVYNPIKLTGGDDLNYPPIREEEALQYDRRGWYVKGTDLYVSKANSGANLASSSRDFTDTDYWTATNGTVGTESLGCVDNTIRATNTFTASAGNATLLQTVTAAADYRTFAVYLKRKTGTGSIQLTMDGGSTWTTVTLTTAWKRFQVSQSQANPQIGIRVVTNADAVYIDSAELRKPDLALFEYLAFPTALALGTDTDTLPDELRDWVVPLAKAFAIYKEDGDFADEFHRIKANVREVLNENFPRRSRLRTFPEINLGSHSGFEAR